MERLTHGTIQQRRRQGKLAEALLAAATMLETNPADLTAWHLLAVTLVEAGRAEEGQEALTSLARAYRDVGDLPMAIVAALECGRAGGDEESLLSELAEAFSAVNQDLVDDLSSAPPPFPRSSEVDLRGARKGNLVDGKVATALALAESALSSREPSPRRFFPLLSALGPTAFAQFTRTLRPLEVKEGEVVVTQGEAGDRFFIVARGEVRVIREGSGTLLARLGPGGFFGEMAIVSAAPRAARVETADEAVLLEADMELLSPLAGEMPELGEVLTAFCRARMLENVVLASPLLARVPVAERPSLIARFAERVHHAGEVVIEEGAEEGGLHLIVSGEVEVTHVEEGETLSLARLGPGDLFGEISLVLRRPATATVTATSETVTLELAREDFLEAIRAHPELLAELYETALKREEETASILGREAVDADDLILV
jgi:cAMP-dependent protein kinase regulator